MNKKIIITAVVLSLGTAVLASCSTAKHSVADNGENGLTNISASNVSEEPKNDINEYTTESETEKMIDDSSSAELSEYSEQVSSEKKSYDERADEIEEIKNHIQRIKETYPDVDERADWALNELFNIYPNLTDEQYVEILKVRGTDFTTAKPYQEAIIAGKNDISSPRLTLEKAKSIIAENNNFDIILDEFSKVQPYPDKTGGSGVTFAIYWLNETGSEQITIILQQRQIIYGIFDADGNDVYTEYLYSGGWSARG